MGFGLEPAPAEPTNPVTPGVLRTTIHQSSLVLQVHNQGTFLSSTSSTYTRERF